MTATLKNLFKGKNLKKDPVRVKHNMLGKESSKWFEVRYLQDGKYFGHHQDLHAHSFHEDSPGWEIHNIPSAPIKRAMYWFKLEGVPHVTVTGRPYIDDKDFLVFECLADKKVEGFKRMKEETCES